MKYLVVVRGFNEPDNNTPSDEIWAKITDIKPSDFAKREIEVYEKFENTYGYGVNVDFYPVAELNEEWLKVMEIW